MKRCSCCKQEKPISQFYRKADTKDGLQYRCKECQSKRAKPVDRAEANNALASYQPRELIAELRRRGYKGELIFEHHIRL